MFVADIFSKELMSSVRSLKANMFQVSEDIQTIIVNQTKPAIRDDTANFIEMFNFPIMEKELMTEIDNYLSIEINYQQSVSFKSNLSPA